MINDENTFRNLLSLYLEDYSIDDLLWDLTVDPADLIIAGIKQGILNEKLVEDIISDE